MEPDCLHDPEITAMIEKVKMKPDRELESSHPKRKGAEVCIVLDNGSKLFKRINLPKGEVENPVSHAELIKKFTYCAEGFYHNRKREEVIERILNIEKIDCIDHFISEV